VNRLSLRLRLTLAFVLAMALLLAAAGTFLYVRLGAALDEQIDATLRTRADDIAALVRGGAGLTGAGLAESDESFAQVLGPRGDVRDATPGLGASPQLRPAELARARHETVVVERGGSRLLATPVGELVVVAGASLEDRNDALGALRTQLLLGGPLVLLLASVAGYVLAAATLRPVLARLEAGLERERRFVAEASHELRTPLSLLKAELELALRRPRSPEELRTALTSAAEETDRLVRLAEDLLVLARADEGELQLRQEPIDARELLDAVARRFAATGRALEVDVPEGLIVTGDRLRLEQALGNLVDNALRYGSGTVRLAARPALGGLTLSVADEGAGFPATFLPHAFERFRRADVARARGAAGLGLALVQAVANAHGGVAAAANLPGGGAIVTLTTLSSAGATSSSSWGRPEASPRGRGNVR
jgi:signal transduction histidine kinase